MAKSKVKSQFEMQDPRTQYAQPPFPKQPQPKPGFNEEMQPRPNHGEESYKGFGRLCNHLVDKHRKKWRNLVRQPLMGRPGPARRNCSNICIFGISIIQLYKRGSHWGYGWQTY